MTEEITRKPGRPKGSTKDSNKTEIFIKRVTKKEKEFLTKCLDYFRNNQSNIIDQIIKEEKEYLIKCFKEYKNEIN